MPSIRQKSNPKRSTFILLGFAIALLATMAIRPAAGLAAPPEPIEPPNLSFEPSQYDFGLQRIEWGATQTNLQLRNNGTETAPIESLEISGPGSQAFWIANSNCYGAHLQPGESCSVQVYFGPQDTSEYAAQLRAWSSSIQFNADLTGVGARPILTPGTNPTDFGVAKVGSAGTTRQITISNVGNAPGGVFIAVISGGAVGSYQLLDENCTGFELAPAATCTVQVRFQPLGEGVKKATLSLFGDGDGGAQVVMTGVGSAPDPVPDAVTGGPAVAAAGGAEPHRPKAKRKRKPGVRKHRRQGTAVQSARLVLKAR